MAFRALLQSGALDADATLACTNAQSSEAPDVAVRSPRLFSCPYTTS